MSANAAETSVLIAGAGPTGLTLACDLARRGVSFRLIDKAPEYFHGSKAKGMQPRSLEVMNSLGLADRLVSFGRFHLPFRNYENGQVTGDRDMYEAAHSTPDIPWACPLMIAQWGVEQVLRESLQAAGQRVELGTELVGIDQDADGVTATIRKGDATEQIRCRYLVGSDGGRSFVRKFMKIGFEGESWPNARMYVGDVSVEGLDHDHWHCWAGHPDGWLGLCPLPSTDSFQFQAALASDVDEEPTLELFQRIVDERTSHSGLKLSNPTWMSLYRVNIRMVDRYRAGRVFLAGDAAHVHTPAGGQGMNTGIQDAWNLGWKLALVLEGADPNLLDSYEEERLPVAASVLGISTRLSREFQSQGNRFSRTAETLQLGIHYRQSSLSSPMNSTDSSMAAGDRAPDALLTDVSGQPSRLFDLLRTPRFTLLATGPIDARALDAFRDYVNVVQEGISYPSALTLIRPDGYVGWQGELSDLASAESYLEQILPARAKEKAAP